MGSNGPVEKRRASAKRKARPRVENGERRLHRRARGFSRASHWFDPFSRRGGGPIHVLPEALPVAHGGAGCFLSGFGRPVASDEWTFGPDQQSLSAAFCAGSFAISHPVRQGGAFLGEPFSLPRLEPCPVVFIFTQTATFRPFSAALGARWTRTRRIDFARAANHNR
jgi:hypothetical protein